MIHKIKLNQVKVTSTTSQKTRSENYSKPRTPRKSMAALLHTRCALMANLDDRQVITSCLKQKTNVWSLQNLVKYDCRCACCVRYTSLIRHVQGGVMLHTANTKRTTSAKRSRQYRDPQKYGIIKGTRVLHFNNVAENKCSKSVHDASAKLRSSLARHFSTRSDAV